MVFRNSLSFALIISFLLLNLSCQTARRRSEREMPGTQVQEQTDQEIIEQPIEELSPSKTPTFLGKEAPRIGLILGPGGMKSYAHIGVLQAFEKAGVPVEVVAGLEWGALAAALYSLQGKANDVDWKMFKLRSDDLPGSGIFSTEGDPGSVSDMTKYLDTVFGDEKMSRAKIPFACPAQTLKRKAVHVQSRGPFGGILRRCIPYPPYFKPSGSWVAVPQALPEIAKYLRGRGANLIIYVDVLSRGRMISDKKKISRYRSMLLWLQVKSLLDKAKPQVNEVITVNTREFSMTDFKNRRNLKKLGLQAGKSALERLTEKYGL